MDINELYQELIVDHGTEPRNHRAIEQASHQADGCNPLCGDKITVFLKLKDRLIEDISFEGQGCAISMASASLMTEILLGKTEQQAQEIFSAFQSMVTDDNAQTSDIGKLEALAGVKAYPMRVKCATLAWHTFDHALRDHAHSCSTE